MSGKSLILAAAAFLLLGADTASSASMGGHGIAHGGGTPPVYSGPGAHTGPGMAKPNMKPITSPGQCHSYCMRSGFTVAFCQKSCGV